MSKSCFICARHESRKPQFDPRVHSICGACEKKLFELAKAGCELHRGKRAATLSLVAKKPSSDRPLISLSTGYQLTLQSKEDLLHLFQAIVGEICTSHAPKRRLRDPMAYWRQIYDMCIRELHYVAGQLHARGEQPNLRLLLKAFGVAWDEILRRMSGGEDKSS